jgi:ABC-type transport system involved in multi-copper enzyme maturation permease subunit
MRHRLMNGKRGGPLGLGPVFAYEWLTGSRRWQGFALRSLFVTLLLTALVVIWASDSQVRTAMRLSVLARFGEQFYVAVIGTQLTLVLLAAPAAAAGAICLDRARGTLAHLLVTDLSDREIVLGKLAARLVPVLGLIGCTLPVMALLTLLGGVDPDALLRAFVVTLSIAVLGCSLALVFSLWAGKTHEALLGTYAVWGLWLLGEPMFNTLSAIMGGPSVARLELADPFALAFAPYWWPGRVGWGEYLGFLGLCVALSALLALLTILRLRSVATRERVRRTRHWFLRVKTWLPTLSRLPGRRIRWPGPTLDFNPVLWREWHRSRPLRWGRIITVLYLLLAVVFSVVALFAGRNGVAAWVNGLQVSIGLLLVSVTAATALAEERVRGSLDLLMSTPLPTWQIVAGKWLGTFRRVPLLAILPAVVILGTPGTVIRGAVGIVLISTFVLLSGAVFTGLGLALATWFSRLGRAVGLTVTLYVLVTVGWLFVAMMIPNSRPENEGLMMASPFFFVGELTFELYDRQVFSTSFLWAIVWLVLYAFTAVALVVAALVTFNHCVGRVERGWAPVIDPTMKPLKSVLLEEVIAESVEPA